MNLEAVKFWAFRILPHRKPFRVGSLTIRARSANATNYNIPATKNRNANKMGSHS
jgi:hypothetical protein